MVRVFFILFISRVASEMRSIQHVYSFRKPRSNDIPTSTTYVYNQGDDIPELHLSFGDNATGVFANEPNEKFTDSLNYKEDIPLSEYTTPSWNLKSDIETPMSFTDYPLNEYSINYEIAKADAKYNSRFLSTKIKTDAKYARLRSMMHFFPAVFSNYDTTGFERDQYRVDSDDFTTSSKGVYDKRPYFYHTPYEYEHMKIDSEIEKAHKKRHTSNNYNDVIPVHENSNKDISYIHDSIATSMYPRYSDIVSTTDNPISGNDPFFSSVLNDYFNNGEEDDTLIFKGYDWSKDYNREPLFVNLDDYAKRNRRLENKHIEPIQNDGTLDSLIDYSPTKTSKIHADNNKIQDLVTHEHGSHIKNENLQRCKHGNNKTKGLKKLIDALANKLRKELDNKNSDHTQEGYKSKDEKGFSNIRHRSENEEDHFYNINNSLKAKEKYAIPSPNIEGSELISQSKILSGNKSDTRDLPGSGINKDYDIGYRINGIIKRNDMQLNRYKDIAKNLAVSNNADYYF